MATFSDSLNLTFDPSSSDDMRKHLQTLLDGKEKQLRQAAALGERLLAQRVELEERIRLLQEMDGDKRDEISADLRERYLELADAVRAWDFGNVQFATTALASLVSIYPLHLTLSAFYTFRRLFFFFYRFRATQPECD